MYIYVTHALLFGFFSFSFFYETLRVLKMLNILYGTGMILHYTVYGGLDFNATYKKVKLKLNISRSRRERMKSFKNANLVEVVVYKKSEMEVFSLSLSLSLTLPV